MGPIARLLGRAEPLAPLVPAAAAAAAPDTALMPLLSVEMLRAPPDRTWLEAAIRVRCRAVPLRADLLLCRILGRYKFHVDPLDQGLAPHLLLDGYWEYWVTEHVCQHCLPGMVAVDVGANTGYYAVLMADLVGEAGHLHAIEPGVGLLRLLDRNLCINGFSARSTIHAVAAGAGPGNAVLRSTATEPKNGYVVPMGFPAPPGIDEQPVAILPLDDLVERADILKIDVEGAEEQVWAGMQRLLDRSPKARILLEFNAGRCHDAAGLLHDIAERYPLRFLDFDAVVKPADPAVLLDDPQDTMLLLAREA